MPHQVSTIVGQAIDQGYDVRVYCREMVEQMRNLMVAAVVPSEQTGPVLIGTSTRTSRHHHRPGRTSGGSETLQEWFQIFSRTEDALRGSLHPRFVFEAAVIKATHRFGPSQVTIPKSDQSPAPAPQPSVTSSCETSSLPSKIHGVKFPSLKSSQSEAPKKPITNTPSGNRTKAAPSTNSCQEKPTPCPKDRTNNPFGGTTIKESF